jgi:hypothetical protein
MTMNPFDHERDAKLGELLRDYLEPSDTAGFVRRVMFQVRSADTSWEVLGRWARPGIAAAVAFLLGVTLWFALNQPADDPTLADAMRPADAPASFLSAREPDNELMLQVVLER